MSRKANSPLVAMNFSGDLMKRVNTRQIFNRAAPENKDWFRVQNAKDDEDKTVVYIYDEIGYWGTSATDFLKVISAIETSEIELHLNSPGGNVWDGIAIYNSLKMHASTVTVYVDALAASAASFIAQAGEKIIMARNAQMMIHDASAMAFGNAEDFCEVAGILDRISNNIADIYSFNAGGKLEEWRALMQEEVWFTAEEAVEAGLADEMLDQADMEAEAASNKWDLTIFYHAGRTNAPSPKQVMGKQTTAPQNTDTPAEPVTPETPAAPEAPETPAEETEEAAPAAPAAPEAPAPAPTPAQPDNKVVLSAPVMVNGVAVTDLGAVQNHITALETFQNETKLAGRKSFVEGLATQNKLSAAKITDTENFVQGLSDEQYEMWKNTWDGALPVPALGQHAGGQSDPSAVAQAQDAATEIENLTEIVRQHKIAGMAVSNIENTSSFKKLKVLKPDYEL
jgi:ATP-dependent protease ClpP protease subunit